MRIHERKRPILRQRDALARRRQMVSQLIGSPVIGRRQNLRGPRRSPDRIDIDGGVDDIGKLVQMLVDVSDLARLNKAEMPFGQRDRRSRRIAPNTGKLIRSKAGAISERCRALATRLRITPAISMSSR